MRTIEKRISTLAVALVFGMASHAAAQPNFEELADNPPLFLETARKYYKWDEPAEPAHIVGPIYFVGTRGISVYLIKTTDGLIVLNSGMPGSGPLIEASIRKLGFDPKDIKLLLTCHAHIDHAAGHAYLQKISGAKIAMLREEKELFESGGKLDFHYRNVKEFEFEPAKVDRVFDDGDVIKLGDFELTALRTSGHTKGATTYLASIRDNGKNYRIVFPDGTGINPGYRLTKNPSYPEIADDFRRTLRILESLEPDIWLHTHTQTFGYEKKLAASATEGGEAWVDHQGYKAWVAAAREKFEATLDRER